MSSLFNIKTQPDKPPTIHTKEYKTLPKWIEIPAIGLLIVTGIGFFILTIYSILELLQGIVIFIYLIYQLLVYGNAIL